MASNGSSSNGSCIAFSATAPATDNVAGYNALTWTPAAEAESIGALSGKTSIIETNLVCNDEAVVRLGATKYDPQSIKLLFHSANPAQQILFTAFNNKEPIWCKETLSTGEEDAFGYKAYVSEFAIGELTAGGMISVTVSLAITGKPIVLNS